VLMRCCCSRLPAPRSSFTGFRFPAEVITVAVREYLRYGLLPRRRRTTGRTSIKVDRSCLVHTLRGRGSAQRHPRGRTRSEGGALRWVGQPAAIYCRISKARDEDQTGVDCQERLCRQVAERLDG
jgi:hypothetical protein